MPASSALATAALVLSAIALMPQGARAQSSAPPIAAGDRVRVRADCPAGSRMTATPGCAAVVGQVSAFHGDTIFVARRAGEAAHPISLGQSSSIEVSAGRRYFTAVGLLGGALAGFVAGAMLDTGPCDSSDGDPCGIQYVATVPLGMLLGGVLISREVWRTAPLHAASFGVMPRKGGVTVALSLRL